MRERERVRHELKAGEAKALEVALVGGWIEVGHPPFSCAVRCTLRIPVRYLYTCTVFYMIVTYM